MSVFYDSLAVHKNVILLLSTFAVASTSLFLLVLLRLAQILPLPASANRSELQTSPQRRRPPPSSLHPTHLIIVLGSGGHTAEMLNILTSIPDLSHQFTRRTYLVSSGDLFSASKAVEFEKEHGRKNVYSVVTVRRARRVHQSFLSTPLTTLVSLWDCFSVLRGTHPDLVTPSGDDTASGYVYPDLILTNGPGTGVCVVVASLVLRFFGYGGRSNNYNNGSFTTTSTQMETKRPKGQTEADYEGQGQMRTVFVESWARVKTLSLSGKILRPLVNRFLVQWPQLADALGDGVEYLGPLVS